MQCIANRYELLAPLGTGGTATVWRTLDTRLQVERALKLLNVETGPDREGQRARLRNEARAMAKLSHPHVVQIHDVGEDGERDYIVMEWMTGGSLADRLKFNGPLSEKDAVAVGVQLLGALQAAHRSKIVHRDVKPGNVLLDERGVAHLCDFGIALHGHDVRNTKTGMALGSLSYMAPEQRRDARSVGPTADLYGLGCTLYNAVTCATPVDLYLAPGRSPRWTGISAQLVEVLRRATAAEPGDRYVDAEAMMQALVQVGRAERIEERALVPPFLPERRVVPPQRVYSALWVNFGVLLVILMVSFVGVQRLQRMVPLTSVMVELQALAPPQFVGRWVGNWDGAPGARLELVGESNALTGMILIRLGPHERVSEVHGYWDIATRELILEDNSDAAGTGVYRAKLGAHGELQGNFTLWDDTTTTGFVFVLTE